MTSFRDDVRYALRQFRRSPGYALGGSSACRRQTMLAAVILTLALGVGINAAIFSVLNAVMLRPLPYPQPERLGALIAHIDGAKGTQDDDSIDGQTFNLVRDQVSSVIAAAYGGLQNSVSLEVDHNARSVNAARVSAHYFEVLGIVPLRGRAFTEAEDREGGANVAVISDSLWRSAMGARNDAVGQTITLKGEAFTVVGILPPNIQTPSLADVWTPLRPSTSGEGSGSNYGALLRLRDGANWSQANAQLAALQPDWLKHMRPGVRATMAAQPMARYVNSEQRTPALVLMLAVSFILLIACANLAGLTLVRMARRTGEMATRLALGASRGALLRQLWTESLMLAMAGGVASLALTALALAAITRIIPAELLPVGGIAIDARVVFFTFAVSMLTSFLFGALPALQSRRVDIRTAIAAGGSRAVSSGVGSLRRAFIAGEVALTVVLLTGAGLLVRTLTYLETLPPGFDATNVTTAKVSLDNARYHDAAAFHRLIHESVAAMQQIPGVESAAVGLSLPYERGLNDGIKVLDGAQSGKQDTVSLIYVTPNYFSTLRIPILAGRAPSSGDTDTSEPVTVVNQSFLKSDLHVARATDAIGTHMAYSGATYRIVGVVGDVVKAPGISQDAPLTSERTVYVPAVQMNMQMVTLSHVWFQPSWIVRTRAPITGIAEPMQRALASVDPSLPFAGVFSMRDLRATALMSQRVEVMLLSVVAALALLLSAVGIYGLISSMVVQRTREIGIRIALGSTVSHAMLTIGRAGITATAAGLTLGIALSALGVRVLRSVLFGVSPYDPITFAVSILLLLVVGLVAAFVPTMRIAKIDPADTLRSE